MKKLLNYFNLFLITGFVLSSCTYVSHDFTLLSTKNIDFNKNYKTSKTRANGEAVVHIILIIPTGNTLSSDTFKQAVDNSIESIPGAVGLTNVVVSYSWWYVPIFYGQQKVLISGDPILDESAKVSDNLFYKGEYNRDNNSVDIKEITETEYKTMKD